jgi:ribosomal protein L11 methyltransferase
VKYIELILQAEHDELGRLTAELAELGVTSTEVRDPADLDELLQKQHRYDWDYVDPSLVHRDPSARPELHLYFEDTPQGREQAENVRTAFPNYKMTRASVDESDWVSAYKAQFHAHRLTEHILVRPSWDQTAPPPGVRVLELDPGMAFGTGDHATTSMCAALLEKAGCSGRRVLDVGTGSGILAICAALLGSTDVLAVDIDEDAVAIAAENVRRNHCEQAVTVRQGDLAAGVHGPVDLVVANLIAEIVCQLTPAVQSLLTPGGIYISSGILTEKQQLVEEAVRAAGLHIIEIKQEGEWSAIAAEKV